MHNTWINLLHNFQCNHTGYDENTATIHMLSHHCGWVKWIPEGIQNDFLSWIPSNMTFVRQACGYLLKKKNLHLTPYLQYLIQPRYKFDKIALLIFARMYQIHIGVILKDRYWSMHQNQSIENFESSDIILAYFGNLNFKDTVVKQISADMIELLPHLAYNRDSMFLTSHTKGPVKGSTKGKLTVSIRDTSTDDSESVVDITSQPCSHCI